MTRQFSPDFEKYFLVVAFPLAFGAWGMYGSSVLETFFFSALVGLPLLFFLERRQRDSLMTRAWFLPLVFPLAIPATTPLDMMLTSLVFSILVGLFAFGGYGRNIFNPFALGVAFLALGYPTVYPTLNVKPFLSILDGFFTDTAGISTGLSFEAFVAENIGSASWGDLLLGGFPGPIGGGYPLYIVVAMIMLYGLRSVDPRFPISAITGCFFTAVVIIGNNSIAAIGSGARFILGGGFPVFLMLACCDVYSLPRIPAVRIWGGVFFGALAAFLTLSARVSGAIPLALLLTNVVSPSLDQLAIRLFYRQAAKP